MTSPDAPFSIPALQQTMAAFAVERQVLAPELAKAIIDKERIAAGLLLCLSLTINWPMGDIRITKIDRIQPPGRNQGLIDFKLLCHRPDRTQIQMGICILTSPNLDVAIEACNRLLVYKDFELDRLCLIRSGDLMANVSQLPTCLPKLLSPNIGGVFVPLKSQDALLILTTLSVFQNKQQHEITNDSIFSYLHETKLLAKSQLIRHIFMAARTDN